MLSSTIKPIEWRDQRLFLLDQRALPHTENYLEYASAESVAEAIKAMVVRGAPAIGIVAAYAVVLAAMQAQRLEGSAWHANMEDAFTCLAAARPTAVNLHWALQRMRSCLHRNAHDERAIDALLREAQALHEEDLQQNLAMAEAGANLLRSGTRVLTHCNTGALATGGYGTALGVIRSAYAEGKIETVYAGETRPWLQGARLTVWELMRDHIPVTLLCEGAVASLMRTENLHWVIVGADRIAANGDVANKIGTYALATLARHHGVGMMVVASCSTIDRDTSNGESIPIEFREAEELLSLYGRKISSIPTAAWNPVFDITPAEYIDVLVTEKGVVHRPDRHGIAALFN